MKLMIHELGAEAIEQVVIPSRNTIVKAIRPHLYRHKFATGSLKMEIHNEDGLIAESEELAIADIGSLDFFHGYVRFYIDAFLKKDVEYTLKLVGADGYSFDEAAYCGWVNGVDLAKYPFASAPIGHSHYPLDYEIWERKQK